MPWDLEERVEDAFVAYLRANASGIKARAAWTPEPAEYPRAVVAALQSTNFSEDAQFSGRRSMIVNIGVMVEASEQKDDAGTVILSARAKNAQIRDSVFSALCVADLHTALNALAVPGVLFSLAHPTQMTRDVADENGRVFVSTLAFDVIAQPCAI